MKKFFTLILSLILCLSLTIPVGAKSDTSSISRNWVEHLMERNGITDDISLEQRTQFYNALDNYISSQLHTDSSAKSARYISNDELQLNFPSIVKLSPDDIAAISGVVSYAGEPDVPSDTTRVSFYGIPFSVTRNGKHYDVFEIVAYGVPGPVGDSSPLYYSDRTNLIANGAHTYNDFNGFISILATAAGTLWEESGNIPSALQSIVDTGSFFLPGRTQALILEYEMLQTCVFAYVSEEGSDTYEFMQSSDRISGAGTVISRAYSGGTIITDLDGSAILRDFEVTSKNYADVYRPVDRYISGATSPAQFIVGDVDINFKDKVKETVPVQAFRELRDIPGAN